MVRLPWLPSPASSVLLLLQFRETGPVAGVELAVLVAGAVALSVSIVPSSLAVRADEGPEDGTGDDAGGSPELVAAALLLRLSISQAELTDINLAWLHGHSVMVDLPCTWSLQSCSSQENACYSWLPSEATN